jgi:hypothetical protein
MRDDDLHQVSPFLDKLKKAQWFPKSVKFLWGLTFTKMEATHQQSPNTCSCWWITGENPKPAKNPLIHRIRHFLLKWPPWFEIRVAPVHKVIRDKQPRPFDKTLNGPDCDTALQCCDCCVHTLLVSKPMLQRASMHQHFYLKPDFSSTSPGCALCQQQSNTFRHNWITKKDPPLRISPCCWWDSKRFVVTII